jgi:hypothetical protein
MDTKLSITYYYDIKKMMQMLNKIKNMLLNAIKKKNIV